MISLDYINDSLKKILKSLDGAELAPDPRQWIDAFTEMNELKKKVQGEYARAHFMLSKNVIDPDAENREKEIREKILPPFEDGSFKFSQRFLKSKHRQAIAERFGVRLLKLLEVESPTLDPRNSERRTKVRELCHEYSKILGTAEISFQGKTLTLSQVRNLQTSPDADTRKSAFLAWRGWFDQNREHLGDLYEKLVQARHQMGKNLGDSNFIPLGYAGMQRTDYGVFEVKTFRENVKKYLVPLVKKEFESLRNAYGTPSLMAWDIGYDPRNHLPSGIAPVEKQLDSAFRVFKKISPHLAEYFVRMREEGWIDLESRKNKQPGAYCTTFPDQGKVAIFCNSTGDASDVSTLMHEMGHAFQAWESLRIEAVELQTPSMDAAEIHSMGMEYLSLKHMTEFFSPEHAKTFAKKRFSDVIQLICYICIVDHFQHWVYENPNVTPQARDRQWDRLVDIYTPGVDFTGIEKLKSARWYAQSHIFQAPFYYIDYAVAEMGALQLAMLDEKNPNQAVERYLELCRLGGTKSVLELFKEVGFRSPFDENLMKDISLFLEKKLYG